jgi:hypothetical protein
MFTWNVSPELALLALTASSLTPNNFIVGTGVGSGVGASAGAGVLPGVAPPDPPPPPPQADIKAISTNIGAIFFIMITAP